MNPSDSGTDLDSAFSGISGSTPTDSPDPPVGLLDPQDEYVGQKRGMLDVVNRLREAG